MSGSHHAIDPVPAIRQRAVDLPTLVVNNYTSETIFIFGVEAGNIIVRAFAKDSFVWTVPAPVVPATTAAISTLSSSILISLLSKISRIPKIRRRHSNATPSWPNKLGRAGFPMETSDRSHLLESDAGSLMDSLIFRAVPPPSIPTATTVFVCLPYLISSVRLERFLIA